MQTLQQVQRHGSHNQQRPAWLLQLNWGLLGDILIAQNQGLETTTEFQQNAQN